MTLANKNIDVSIVPHPFAPIANAIDVYMVPHPFAAERVHHCMESGLSIAEIIGQLQPDPWLARHAHVYLNGDYVPHERWAHVTPKAGTQLSIRLVPMGGGGGSKNPLRTVLSIAIMAGTAEIGGFFAGSTFMGFGVSGVIRAGLGLAGNLLLNALAPPPKPRFTLSTKQSPTLFIQGARNQATPFGRVPKVLGKHRFVPPLGAQPYTETVGNDQYLRMLFVWGYGPLDITDLKIGETPLSSFSDVQVETRSGYADDAPLTLYTDSIIQDDLQVALANADGTIIRTTRRRRRRSRQRRDIGFRCRGPRYYKRYHIMNYAVINADNIVINVIVWDGITPYNPGAGLTLVRSDTAAIGHTYQDGAFIQSEQSGG